MTGTEAFAGRRVLVGEDEDFLADDVARGLEANGAEVIGPVGDVDGALDLIEETGHLEALRGVWWIRPSPWGLRASEVKPRANRATSADCSAQQCGCPTPLRAG